MKKISKIISLLMAAVIALSVFAVSASAVATELAAGSTKATATKIPSFGTEYVSSLSKAGEQDWFKFTTLSDDAYYTIALENYNINSGSNSTQQVNLFVYDTYLKEISFLSDTSSTNIKLEKNTTYYIKVTMGYNRPEYTGNYEILLTYILDPVSNNMSEATAININRSYDYSLDGTGDIDWYKFDAPISGTYKMSLVNKNIQEGWNDTQYLQMHLMDEYQKTISTCYSTSSAEVTLEKGHTYYIKIVMGHNRSYWIGNYGFSVTCDSVSAKTLSKISVASMPNKTTYKVGESFDKTGLAIKAHYSDGTTAKVTSYTVSGFSSTTAGTKTITVKYTEGGVTKSCTFTVKVTDTSSTVDLTVALSSITIEKGGSLTVGCSYTGSYDGTITVNYNIADNEIVSCSWGEWESDAIPLTINGLEAGSTVVTVNLIDYNTKEVLDTEKINVTVTDDSGTEDSGWSFNPFEFLINIWLGFIELICLIFG